MMAMRVGLLMCLCAKASADWKPMLNKPALDNWVQQAYEQLPKELVEAAGFPTPEELVCKALNNTKLQAKFEDLVCSLMPSLRDGTSVRETLSTQKACRAAVQFAWKQEMAEEKCPGAGKSWWPFHMLHKMANKLICYELKKGNFHDQEKNITKGVCAEMGTGDLDLWACEAAMHELWEHFESDCKIPPLLKKIDDILV